MVNRCIVCKEEVDFEIVKEEFEPIFEQADSFGLKSLTEGQQHVLEGRVCKSECYTKLP